MIKKANIIQRDKNFSVISFSPKLFKHKFVHMILPIILTALSMAVVFHSTVHLLLRCV